jgi:hypothetical protein
MGIAATSNDSYGIGIPASGGSGLFGFGAGGSGAVPNSGVVAHPGLANTGNGGAGKFGGATPIAGAVGGSGYCLISYWS